MGFGIILMVLFGLLAIGILILIVCMLVIGLRRISKKSKPVEKPAQVQINTDNAPEKSAAKGVSPVKDSSTEKTP